MGQQFSSISETNRLYEMPLNQYGLKERMNWALSTWKNKSSPYQQLIQCRMVVNSQEELRNIYDIFKMRHMHMYLPATKYLTCQQYGIKGCGEYYKGNIYLDSAIANLSLINDIPFIDSLHIYSVALKGYEILYRKFGYFDVFEDMFHICENGKLKVWCNSELYKLSPESYLLDINGRQQDMIYRILNIIDQNVDKSDPFNMKQLLYRRIQQGTHYKTFEQVNMAFRNICKENNWQPPQRLKCISQLTRQDIHKLILQQHNMQKQYPQNQESKGLLTANSLNNDPISPPHRVINQGLTSIRVPIMQQTPRKVSQPTLTQIPSTHAYSQRPENNNTSLVNLLENSDQNRIRYYGGLSNPNTMSVPVMAGVVDNTPRIQQRYVTTRANTPEIRPRENRQIIENKPTVKILSVQKNNQMRNANVIPYHYPPQQPFITPHPPPHLFQTTPQPINLQHRVPLVSSTFQPKSPVVVQNSIKLSTSNKQLNLNSLSGTAKFIQTPPGIPHQPQNNVQSVRSSKHQQQSKKLVEDRKPDLDPKLQVDNNNGEKFTKSIIIPELSINSNQNRANGNSRKGSDSGLKRHSSSNSEKNKETRQEIPSTFHFEERFQQSIQPQLYISKQKQFTNYSISPKYTSSPSYQRPISPQQTLSSYPKIYQAYTPPPVSFIDQAAQYTDPKLLSMLSSSKNRSSITINPTFNFNLNNQSKATNKELYYSFSSNKNTENKPEYREYQVSNEYLYGKDSFKKQQKQFQSSLHYNNSIKYPEQESSNHSSQSLQQNPKKYQTNIDKQIWKDLLQLKKHKNLY